MQQRRCSLNFFSIFIISILAARCSADNILALIQYQKYVNTHGQFFDSLRQRGHSVDIKLYRDETLQLKDWDSWLYQHLILFTPTVEVLGGALDVDHILEFIDAGNNVLIGLDSEVSDFMRELVSECGMDVGISGTKLLDHQNYAVTNEGGQDHMLIPATDIVTGTPIFKAGEIQAPVLYKGNVMVYPASNSLINSAMWAPPSAYAKLAKAPADGAGLIAGHKAGLVTIMQARNNARVTVSGSISMFSNAFYQSSFAVPSSKQRYEKSGNEKFCEALSKWTFKERGVLKVENIRHQVGSLQEGDNSSFEGFYRIKDGIEFAMDIFELDDGAWVPHRGPDVQVELVMLDPYIRATLTHNDKGTFSTKMKLPDVYGVFKFVVDHARLGYTYVTISEEKPIRPFRHNEFERFITSAFPYYASSVSMMVGFFIFGFLFLYHK